jgi:hypothetical protein
LSFNTLPSWVTSFLFLHVPHSRNPIGSYSLILCTATQVRPVAGCHSSDDVAFNGTLTTPTLPQGRLCSSGVPLPILPAGPYAMFAEFHGEFRAAGVITTCIPRGIQVVMTVG